MSWRTLVCTRCDEEVSVWEYTLIEGEEVELVFVDPELFVCERCSEPAVPLWREEHEQREERRRYDPTISAIPF